MRIGDDPQVWGLLTCHGTLGIFHTILVPLFVPLTPLPVEVEQVVVPMARVPASLLPFRIPMLLRAPPIRFPVPRVLALMILLVPKVVLRLVMPMTVHRAVKTPPKLIPGRWCVRGTRLFLKLVRPMLEWVPRFPSLKLVAPLPLELTLWFPWAIVPPVLGTVRNLRSPTTCTFFVTRSWRCRVQS